MPTGRPLRLPQAVVDPTWLREQFAIYGTECEVPRCGQPADWYRQTDYVFIYLCGEHDGDIGTLTQAELQRFDRMMAEHMWYLWTRKLYVHVNNDSGFELEAMLAERDALLSKQRRADAAAPGKIRRELRKGIQQSGTKIGAPDDELITARGRNHLRQLIGKSPLGPGPKAKTSLVPRLVIPSARFTTPSDTTPDPSKAE